MNKKPGNSVGVFDPKRPGVYRPQPIPKVLQTKKAIGPSAPPVYRPQPAPKVLQTKMRAGVQSATRPTPATNRTVSFPVYQLPLPKVLQAKSARPQSLPLPPKPAPPRHTQVGPTRSTSVVQRASAKRNSPAPAAQPTARSTVIQRVTYKGVLYDPASEDAQTNFLAEAKRDMVAAGTWAPGRSENMVKAIGLTTKTILDAGALGLEERSLWKEYDVAVDADLQSVVAIHRDMHTQLTALEGLIPRLRGEDVSAQINAAVAETKRLFGRLPEKWNLHGYGVANFEKPALNKLMTLRPWTLAERIRIAEEDLAIAVAKSAPQPAGPPPAQAPPVPAAAAARPVRSLKKVTKELADLKEVLASVDDLERQALASVATMKQVKQMIETDIRQSAAGVYEKGKTGYVSPKSRMTTRKFYLGEIATTEPLTRIRQKGRGVLWARPWSPGVNRGFLEGGVEAGAVYKLKTAVPDGLKQHLVGGDSAAFKAAVSGQASDPFRPFWHGGQGRFTIYTDELSYLAGKGYRLHEFRRKNGSMQQLMIHPNQLAAVTAAYAGR
ncbi:MAG TPA: hypothetical protein VFR51_08285 [Pyrinomonadaceae bacterium]|nr:hypothetical protein [Pyrinomonadaceae bacterium]